VLFISAQIFEYLKQQPLHFIFMDFQTMSDEILAFTKELVAIPSDVTERAIANRILEKFDELGIKGDVVGGDLEHPSIISLMSKPTSSKTLLLEAPLDTSSTGNLFDWKHNPFETQQEGNKLYGLGIADAKFALAMYTYLTHYLEKDDSFHGSIFLGFDAQEQNGKFIGIREIIPYLPRLDGVIMGYQSYDEIHIGARGWLRLKLQVHGEAYHTGAAKKKGVNAIHKLLTAIKSLQNIDLYSVEPYFEYGSNFNVSTIHGGEAINIVPSHAEAFIDIRLTPSQDPKEVLYKFQNALTTISNSDPNFKYTLDALQAERGYITDPNNELVRILQNNVNTITKQQQEVALKTSGPGGVGNILSQLEIPIINAFGVRSGGVHSSREWIDVTTVPPVLQTLYNTINDFCNN
jgi:succinyl-diaminopimelate desuccinylase